MNATATSALRMTEGQATELSKRLYGDNLLAKTRAGSIREKVDRFEADSIIITYMNRPMMSDADVANLVRDRLGMEAA